MSRSGEAANVYGFDFLRNEHKAVETIDTPSTISSTLATASVLTPTINQQQQQHKPDLEKQFDVLHFLQAHRSAGYMAPSVIYRATGIDLEDPSNEAVVHMLERNPKIRVEHVPDPENPSLKLATYSYQAKYHFVRDRASLLAQINRCLNGVAQKDLLDAYDGVENDLAALITAGDVVAVANPEDRDKILFPRGETFLVELDGLVIMRERTTPTVSVPAAPSAATTANGGRPLTDDEVVAAALRRQKLQQQQQQQQQQQDGNKKDLDRFVVQMDVSPLEQIRRGEAVCVGGQWFRVSSAVREGEPLSEQPARAQAPLSVTSFVDMSSRNLVDGYIRPFSDKLLPLDAALTDAARDNLLAAKTARDRLHKLAGGRGMSGGVAAQLLSSTAHSTNPTTLASSFASSVGGSAAASSSSSSSGGGVIRKRPSLLSHRPGGAAGHHATAQQKRDAQAAKEAASDPALSQYSHARRHGCTKDVRQLYLQSREWVPHEEAELYQLMQQHKLLQPGEAMKRPRLAHKKDANLDNDGKPKKRRYYERKDQRMTNLHLVGTEIGAALAAAAEKQKQGKEVGDGGM